jgi:hypothetical protein
VKDAAKSWTKEEKPVVSAGATDLPAEVTPKVKDATKSWTKEEPAPPPIQRTGKIPKFNTAPAEEPVPVPKGAKKSPSPKKAAPAAAEAAAPQAQTSREVVNPAPATPTPAATPAPTPAPVAVPAPAAAEHATPSVAPQAHTARDVVPQEEEKKAPSTPTERTVHFSVTHTAKFGEAVYVVGGASHLGDWAPEKALLLKWSDGNVWHAETTVPESLTSFEYKYLVQSATDKHWESGGNRTAQFAPDSHSLRLTDTWRV